MSFNASGLTASPAEVMQKLLHLTGEGHRLAQVIQCLAGVDELLPALSSQAFHVDVVVTAVACINVQLVGAINRDGLLHVAEEFLEVDMAVILVLPIQPVGAAYGLEQVVVVKCVVEVNVGAAWCIRSR